MIRTNIYYPALCGDDIYVLTRLFEQVKIIENGFNLIHDNFNDSWIINL